MAALGDLITAICSGISVLILAYVAVKQLPQVHKLVNSANTELKDEVAMLRATIADKDAAALTKAEAREAPAPEASS